LDPKFLQEIRTARQNPPRFIQSSPRATLALPLPLGFIDARPVDSAKRPMGVVFDAELNSSGLFLSGKVGDQRSG
jgi:hypothetical protein